MRRTRHNKKIGFTALLLLAVFVNMYLVQLVCSLPHLAQKLAPAVSAQEHHHGAAAHEHSSAQEHHAAAGHHHSKKPAAADINCCTEQGNTPFLKTSATVEQPEFTAAQPAFFATLLHTLPAWPYRSHINVVWQAPPKNLKPKIPDIRVFLHSFLI